MRMLDRVNRISITPELLGDAMELHADLLPDERGSVKVRTARLIELLDRRKLTKGGSDLVVALELRLQALNRVLMEGTAKGWTLPTATEATFVHRDLISAAAAEPMIFDVDGNPAFDQGAFQARLLLQAKVGGEA